MSEPAQPHAAETAAGGRGPVVLVISPNAGSARAGDPVACLEQAGVTVGLHLEVHDLDRATSLGPIWRDQGFRAVVAAGGDGTIGAVASHVAGSGLPLGILPMGTSNDTARSLGVPLDLAQACDTIAHGMPTAIDVGLASPAVTEPWALTQQPSGGADGSADRSDTLAARGAYFLHALTLGFNVQFARLATDVARRQRWGALNYATSVLEALTHFQPVTVTLRLSGVKNADGQDAEDLVATFQALQVAVVNTPVFGGAFNLRLPDVRLRDDLLDFVVIEALDPNALRNTVEGLLGALNNIGDVLRERVSQLTQQRVGQAEQVSPARADEAAGLALPGVRRFKAREAIVETQEPLDLTLDGEIRARTPAHIRVAPDSLHILLPVEAHAALIGEEVQAEAHQASTKTS